MRKIKYKKGRKAQLNQLDYTGSHKQLESEMQLFVYDDSDFAEYQDLAAPDFNNSIDFFTHIVEISSFLNRIATC